MPNSKWNLDFPTKVQCRTEDGVIRLAEIDGVVQCGIQDVYHVVTESGKCIVATKDHRFLSESGWKQLKELKNGDRVWVRSNQSSDKVVKSKSWYKYAKGLHRHPYKVWKNSVPVHRLVVEASLNNLDYSVYVCWLREQYRA